MSEPIVSRQAEVLDRHFQGWHERIDLTCLRTRSVYEQLFFDRRCAAVVLSNMLNFPEWQIMDSDIPGAPSRIAPWMDEVLARRQRTRT